MSPSVISPLPVRRLRCGYGQDHQAGSLDGVIAPGYEPEALEILKSKKNGNYNVIAIDPVQTGTDRAQQVYGIVFEQERMSEDR